MTKKHDLHALVDHLPERVLPEAERYLRILAEADGDPVALAFLNAADDDEPLSSDEIAAIEEGIADITAGKVIPWEEAWERLRTLD